MLPSTTSREGGRELVDGTLVGRRGEAVDCTEEPNSELAVGRIAVRSISGDMRDSIGEGAAGGKCDARLGSVGDVVIWECPEGRMFGLDGVDSDEAVTGGPVG